MKCFLFIVTFSIAIFASDSTATLILNGTSIKIEIPDEFYVDLVEFQNFLNSNIQELHFSETIIDELTGDNISDTLYNEIYIVADGCIIKSKILSNGFMVYSDSTIIFNDEGNWENIWGSDSIYYQLFPYSLLYNGYSIRVVAYTLERERIEDNIFMYLSFRQNELEKMGLSKDIIESRLIESKEYVKNYKGKFIHNISLANPDTYIYETPLNKFVIFYSP